MKTSIYLKERTVENIQLLRKEGESISHLMERAIETLAEKELRSNIDARLAKLFPAKAS